MDNSIRNANSRPPRQSRTGLTSTGARKAGSKSARTRAREFALQGLYQSLVGRNTLEDRVRLSKCACPHVKRLATHGTQVQTMWRDTLVDRVRLSKSETACNILNARPNNVAYYSCRQNNNRDHPITCNASNINLWCKASLFFMKIVKRMTFR